MGDPPGAQNHIPPLAKFYLVLPPPLVYKRSIFPPLFGTTTPGQFFQTQKSQIIEKLTLKKYAKTINFSGFGAVFINIHNIFIFFSPQIKQDAL